MKFRRQIQTWLVTLSNDLKSLIQLPVENPLSSQLIFARVPMCMRTPICADAGGRTPTDMADHMDGKPAWCHIVGIYFYGGKE